MPDLTELDVAETIQSLETIEKVLRPQQMRWKRALKRAVEVIKILNNPQQETMEPEKSLEPWKLGIELTGDTLEGETL